MSAGLPVTSGAVQLTFTLLNDAPSTVGSAGAPGGSTVKSVTVTVRSWDASTVVSALPRESLPSCTRTVIA